MTIYTFWVWAVEGSGRRLEAGGWEPPGYFSALSASGGCTNFVNPSPAGQAAVILVSVGWHHSLRLGITFLHSCFSSLGSGLLLLPISGLLHFVHFGFSAIPSTA